MKKEPRPVVDLPNTLLDNILEIGALTVVILTLVFAWTAYGRLPETIPTHFNGAGEADGYGAKSSFWILPALSTLLIPSLLWLSRQPHKFNYLNRITPENAEAEYRRGQRVMRSLALGIALVFGVLTLHTARLAQGESGPGGPWLLFAVIAMSAGAVFYLFRNPK